MPRKGGGYWLFVKLMTDEGVVGYGEAYWIPLRLSSAVRMVEDMGRSGVIGMDPFRVEKLWEDLYGSYYGQHPDIARVAAISAFEIACWDIIGKTLDRPVYDLLGGVYNERLRSYTYLYTGDDADSDKAAVWIDPERAAERSAAYVEQGFTAVKLDPIRGEPGLRSPWELSLQNLSNAEAVVRRVRETVGDACDIILGTHGQMTTSSAIRLARRLEPYDPLWFEEPVRPENAAQMAKVARSTSIPIAAGERLATRWEFARLMREGAVSVVQPALGRAGGILEGKKIAALADVNFGQIAPHLWAGPIEAAASIQLDVCCTNFLIQESIEDFTGFYSDILTEPIRWSDGYIIPPAGPGLGTELNEELVRRHAADI
jgi:2-dehydro-3-deoxyphosphogalactonate aldolase